ncbi:type II toxin-antitoxin system PemK/MazF family toxin [Chamaesiphon sp. OTE_75_metabat_556]|uniref:type II toxin-antitoxin system PemK/MazF family toxin n=1 Tax=Chamaesiphon sp. OTE_75_metabat_556 TaxID=2964692 RepID=UPI00286D3D32|nr:type II toxin-antitoxin system PemK/MazF family toxin [Chamaesiphon sp. OTE_75_metabat_556]
MARSLENLQQGSVVSVLFPVSDASAIKRRPAFLLAPSDRHNFIFCPITSKSGRTDEIEITDLDFQSGRLNISPCYIRPNVIATINRDNIIRQIALLNQSKIDEVVDRVIIVLQRSFE